MGTTGVAIDTNETQPLVKAELANRQPPVIVLNLFYCGLGIVRDMAGRR